MADRSFDRILKCGCMISANGGGGLMPCHYGPEFGATNEEIKLCRESWEEWKQTEDYQRYQRECIERNQ